VGLFKRASTLPPDPIRSPRERVRTATDGRDVLVNTPDAWEIDEPWLWWLGPANGDGTGGPYGNPIPGANAWQAYATLPGVARCTSIICDTIAGLPWQVIRGEWERLPTPDWIADPQALRIDGRVVDPNTLATVRLSAVEFWSQWIQAALWLGDGYVYVPVRDAAGAPKPPVWQLHPDDVKIDAGAYWVGDIPLPADSIIHLRGPGPYIGGHGNGVLTNHALDLTLARTVRAYASGVFQTGVPAGYLKSTSPSMTPDQAQDLKAKWLAQHGGAARSIAVLNATTDFHPIAISPVDAQLSSSREWALRDIALAFGVPAYALGVPGDSATYANVESRMIELRTFTLLPWERRIESTIDAQFARGTSLRIRSDGLLRADTATRYKGYKDALDAGWLTVDEIRALEDRPPIESEAVT
jgi:HK97 family phage portal protein